MDPAQLIRSGMCRVKKYISEGVPRHNFVEEREKKKAIPASFIFFAWESYRCSPQSNSRNCNYAFVYQRSVFTPDLVSVEMRCPASGNCHLQAGCSHTAIAQHQFPRWCDCGNLPIFTQGNSSLFWFYGLYIRFWPVK